MQSKAFDKSMKAGPTMLLLSRLIFQFSIDLLVRGLHCSVFGKLRQSLTERFVL